MLFRSRVDTYFPAPKLKCLFDARPDIWDRVSRGEALIGTIDTFLIYRLTAGRVFATDHTNASRTLLYDIHRLAFDSSLCDLFDVPVRGLARVRESGGDFGVTDVQGLLAGPVPIRGVMGDSQAALFAQRCFQPGEGKVTFGTGSSVLVTIGDRPELSAGGLVTALGWVHAGRPSYTFEGIINCTGATIHWLKDELGLIATPAESEQLAASVPDTGGVYLVPAFAGLSAPYWAPQARGAIVGLSRGSSKAHLVRAALESIAYQVRDILDLVAADAGQPLKVVNADGGMVANRLLMQMVADVTGVPIGASQTEIGRASCRVRV